MPDGELPVWQVSEYRRTTDLANAGMRIEQRRDAKFLFCRSIDPAAGSAARRRFAYTVGQDGKPARQGDAAARDRRIEGLHHPLAIVRAALDPAARLANPRQQGLNSSSASPLPGGTC